MPPQRLPGEIPGQTQDTLERLCLLAGLGTPSDAPGRLGGSGWGEGSLGFPVKDTVPVTRTQISGRQQGTRYGIVREEKYRQQLHMCFYRWFLKTVWMTDEKLHTVFWEAMLC